MANRRDTYTALLFLAGMLAGAVLLISGLLVEYHFSPRTPPPRSTVRTKASVIANADERKTGPVARRSDRLALNHQPTPLPSLKDAGERLDELIESTEPALNEVLDRDHAFIQLYGGFQKLLGRRVVEDVDPQYTVVKLTDQLLTFADLESEQVDLTQRAEEMCDFADKVWKEYRVPVLYVQAPSKLDMAPLPDGLVDHSGAEADQFLALLKQGGVDTLDLRPAFQAVAEEDPQAAEDYFFHTDHHWTPAGAFLGYQVLSERLSSRYRFKLKDEWTDPKAYNKYNFKDAFLGSQGRRVGSLYAGLDDFEIWSPTFSTDFTYTVPLVGVQREGPFAASLLFPERLADTDNYYNTNQYAIYSGGDYLLARARNEKNPDGKRILILRDSFGCAITPFLSIISQEVMTIDPRQFNGNQDTMMTFVDWLEPDVLIVLNTTGSIRVDKLYPYLPTARENALLAKEEGK